MGVRSDLSLHASKQARQNEKDLGAVCVHMLYSIILNKKFEEKTPAVSRLPHGEWVKERVMNDEGYE